MRINPTRERGVAMGRADGYRRPGAVAPVRSGGFSMVEMLVVISLIMLLVAMLLPALTQSRYDGRSLLCGTRHKNLLTGLDAYANDNNNWYPTRFTEAPSKVYVHPYWWSANALAYDMHEVAGAHDG
jgi:type II secretory pathway pseudopilin PulG